MTDAYGKRMGSALAAMIVVAAAGLAVPAMAQGGKQPLNICALRGDGALELGKFRSNAQAVAAAREQGVPAGKYALAMVGDRSIAINSAGRVFPVSGNVCVGSGPGMQKPE